MYESVSSVDDAVAALYPLEPAPLPSIFFDLEQSIENAVSTNHAVIDPFATNCGWKEDSLYDASTWDDDLTSATSHLFTGSALSASEESSASSRSSPFPPAASHRCCDTVGALGEHEDSSSCGSPPAGQPAQKKRKLRAWTIEEHRLFVQALDKFRTKYTEAVDADGKKTKGLGPGVAEMIATMIGTRNAAQVRSHAQKYFTRQRRDMGLC
jgi:hypothetical protein